MKRFIPSKNRRIFYLAWEKTEGFFTTLIIRRHIMTNKKTSSGMVLALLAFGFLLGGCASLGKDIQPTAISAYGNKAVVSDEKKINVNAMDYTTEETPLLLPAPEMLKLPGLTKTPFGYALSGQLWFPTNPPSMLDLPFALQMPKLPDGKAVFPKELPIPQSSYKPFIPDMKSPFDVNAAREQQLKYLERSLYENVDIERYLKRYLEDLKRDSQKMLQNTLAGLDTYLKQHPTNLSK